MTQNNGSYEVNLDTRRLKTPRGQACLIPSRPLALAIASEWQSQKTVIKQAQMHLTSLTFTSIDNPMNSSNESLTDKLVDFLETDTVCYRSEEPEELRKKEDQRWNPIVDWFTRRYNVEVDVISNLLQIPVPEETLRKMRDHLIKYNLPSLIGFTFVCENLKSVILALALLERHIDVEQAVSLSLLETEFQTKTWGHIEWAHELDLVQLRSRVAAGVFFTLCHQDSILNHTKVSKQV